MARIPSAAAAHIGAQIADVRRRRGYTQDQLAVLSGIDSSNIRSYESGRAMLSVLTLVRISTALEVTPGTLIDELTPEQFVSPAAAGRQAAAG